MEYRISYKYSKFLKSLGFEEYCDHYYDPFGCITFAKYTNNFLLAESLATAPDFNTIRYWLRLNHKIDININKVTIYGENIWKIKIIENKNNEILSKTITSYHQGIQELIEKSIDYLSFNPVWKSLK